MTVAAEPWTPACMDAPEWAGWQKANRSISATSERLTRPCDECPLGFALEMRQIDRCNGTPSGAPEDEEEPMEQARPALVVAGGREIKVTASLPCERCAHAPVCRIRPTLEAQMESLPVTLPRLDPAIGVVLSAAVECREFMRTSGVKAAPAGEPKKRVISEVGRIAMSMAAQARRAREREAATA